MSNNLGLSRISRVDLMCDTECITANKVIAANLADDCGGLPREHGADDQLETHFCDGYYDKKSAQFLAHGVIGQRSQSHPHPAPSQAG